MEKDADRPPTGHDHSTPRLLGVISGPGKGPVLFSSGGDPLPRDWLQATGHFLQAGSSSDNSGSFWTDWTIDWIDCPVTRRRMSDSGAGGFGWGFPLEPRR
jgi:hypothetical protein